MARALHTRATAFAAASLHFSPHVPVAGAMPGRGCPQPQRPAHSMRAHIFQRNGASGLLRLGKAALREKCRLRVQRRPARDRLVRAWLRILEPRRDCICLRRPCPILAPPRVRVIPDPRATFEPPRARARALILVPLLEPFDVRARLAAEAFGRFRLWPRMRVVPRRPPMSMISRFMLSLFAPP